MKNAACGPVKSPQPEIEVYNIVYAFSGNMRFYGRISAPEAAQ